MATRRKLEIKPELSAQRMSHPPNPALKKATAAVNRLRGNGIIAGKVADLGCGKLRHFKQLSALSSELYLVDKETQLTNPHVNGKLHYTVRQFASTKRKFPHRVHAMSSSEFARSRLHLDVIFCIAVVDVVLQEERRLLYCLAERNLRSGGYFVLIAPRNDSSILSRCSKANRYRDGHVFHHHGAATFYKNFRSIFSLVRDCASTGLTLVADLSRYRQVSLIFRKP